MGKISQRNHIYLTIDGKIKVNLEESKNEIDLRVQPNAIELYLNHNYLKEGQDL